MNRKTLLIALLCSLFLLSSLPAISAKKAAAKKQTFATSTQSQEQTRDDELPLLPEVLERLAVQTTDDTDLGPEVQPEDSDESSQSSDESDDDDDDDEDSSDEPNLLNMEDDSDELENIYNEDKQKIIADEEAEDSDSDGPNPSDASDSGEIAMTAVAVDGKFHRFEVKNCTVIEIPINRQSFKMTVNSILNSDVAMLTDAQLATCSQIVNFVCPEEATFCRKQSLEANNNEVIEIDQEACNVENAYLYVLPSDMSEALAYDLKVKLTGTAECENVPVVNGENQMIGNGDGDEDDSSLSDGTDETDESDTDSSDEDSDDSSDNADGESDVSDESDDSYDSDDTDDSDEIQDDLSDDPDQPFDDKILTEQVAVDGKPHTFEVETCTVVEIPINQRAIHVSVDNLINSETLMLTDAQISNCSTLKNFQCPPGNTFCKFQDLSDPTGVDLGTEACGVQTAYLYVLPSEFIGIMSYQVNVSVTNDSQCDNLEASTDNAAGTAGVSTSDSEDDSDSEDNTSAETANDNESENEDQTQSLPEGDSGLQQATDGASKSVSDKSSRPDAGTIIAIIFGVSLALFMAIVCIYRYRFRKSRVELFHPPSWCPRCLFPRSSEGLINFNVRSTQYDHEYEPPVL